MFDIDMTIRRFALAIYGFVLWYMMHDAPRTSRGGFWHHFWPVYVVIFLSFLAFEICHWIYDRDKATKEKSERARKALGGLLCKVGIHSWDYIPEGIDMERHRRCGRCGLSQTFDDKSRSYESDEDSDLVRRGKSTAAIQGFLGKDHSCPNCGGDIIGDGYTEVRHCENSESDRIWDSEADAPTILCEPEEKTDD